MKTKFLDKQQMDKLVRYLTENRSKLDTYLFFELMLRTGCRTDEFVRIRPCDLVRIDDGYEVTIFKGSKGSNARRFKLDSFRSNNLCEAILARCNAYRMSDRTPVSRLISDGTSESTKRLMRRHWDDLMDTLFGAAGYKYSLHSLRHTFAKMVYEKSNKDVVAVSKGLGHKDLKATGEYLSHIVFDIELYKNAI